MTNKAKVTMISIKTISTRRMVSIRIIHNNNNSNNNNNNNREVADTTMKRKAAPSQMLDYTHTD